MSRRTRVSITIIAGTLLVGSGFGFAVAQDDGDEVETEGDGGEVAAVERSNLTPQQQIEAADEMVESANQTSRTVSAMLAEARREVDMIKVTCLDDKLTQVNANIRSLTNRVDQLRSAVEAADASRGGHEFTVISVLDQKIKSLQREANACIGEDIYNTGATTVTTEIDPGTPVEDLTVIPSVPPSSPVPYIPPPASGDR